MNEKRILGLYAHPDDEILGSGGTMARYAAAGARVETVCATRGEAGEIADALLATPENLSSVREQEMLCSAQALGIQKVHFLDHRDSGMDGTADNERPDAFINIPADVVVGQLVQIIRQLRPQVLVTFEPFGGYGHPDHIAIHHHTRSAYSAAADATYRPDLGPVWQTARLFYVVVPMSFFERLISRMKELGLNTDFAARFEERREKGWPEGKISCVMDVQQSVEAKWQAYKCHPTQFGADGLFSRLPEAEMKALLQHEYFYLAAPEQADLQLTDLFEGIDDA
jgi:LmbE family N-acetylglucosaminyl deacetylase